jgi:hypothetical protein
VGGDERAGGRGEAALVAVVAGVTPNQLLVGAHPGNYQDSRGVFSQTPAAGPKAAPASPGEAADGGGRKEW